MTTAFLLSDLRPPRDEGAEYLYALKTAGAVGDVAKKTSEFVRKHHKEIGAALVGGALVAGTEYAMDRPGKNGQSKNQILAGKAHKAVKGRVDAAKAEGREPGMGAQVGVATTKAVKDIADVFAKNPGKAALLAVPMGLAAGPKLLRMATKTAMKKEALSLGTLKSVAKPMVGKAMHAATAAPAATRMAVGAGAGATMGLMKSPGVDPATGQQKSRLGGMVAGAAMGAGAGAGAKALAMRAGSMNNAAGRFAGGALKQQARQSGNLAAMGAARQMQVGRGAAMSAARDAAGKPLHNIGMRPRPGSAQAIPQAAPGQAPIFSAYR